MLETRHLLTLSHVADEGSIAGAARRLGYTASAVSQQMVALEKALGVPLLERSAQRIRLTAAARVVLERGRSIVAAVGALESEVRTLATGLAVLLHVGTFPSAGAEALPKILATLRSQVPLLSVTLDEGEPPELVARVDDGSLDAALIYRYGLDPLHIPDRLSAEPLMSERLFLIGPREDVRHHRGDVDLAELGEVTWISARDGSAGARSLARLFAVARITPMVALRSNNYAMVRGLVDSGEGIAIVPELALPHDYPGSVWQVDGAGARRDILLVTRGSNASAGVTEFTEVARSVFDDLERRSDDDPRCAIAPRPSQPDR